MAKIVRNADSVAHTWVGQIFNPADTHTITATEATLWANDSTLLIAIAAGLAVMNDGSADVTDVALAIALLQDNTIKPVNIAAQIDPPPFAVPTYRNKRDATSVVTCAKNATTDITFAVTEERYIYGGNLIVENAEFGDYIVAEVTDDDSVIPSPYRAALCEAWPIVATYIVKAYIPIKAQKTLTVDAFCEHTVNTYPLTAKITAGLYLKTHYHAVNVGGDRRVVLNYFLAKKL